MAVYILFGWHNVKTKQNKNKWNPLKIRRFYIKSRFPTLKNSGNTGQEWDDTADGMGHYRWPQLPLLPLCGI